MEAPERRRGTMTNVVVSLRDARAIARYLGSECPDEAPVLRRLSRAIARANRALVPGRWFDGSDYRGLCHRRLWRGTEDLAAVVRDSPEPHSEGWCAFDPAYNPIASGPETGAEGRRLADRALARWAKRQGWRPAPKSAPKPTPGVVECSACGGFAKGRPEPRRTRATFRTQELP